VALLRSSYFEEVWASPLDKSKRDDIRRILAVGDRLDVFVRFPDPCYSRLFLDSRQITPKFLALETTALVNERKRNKKKWRRNSVSKDDIGSERIGSVVSVMKYGFRSLRSKWQDLIQPEMEVDAEIIKVEGDRVNLKLLNAAGISTEEEEEATNIVLERPEARNAPEEEEDLDDVSEEATVGDDVDYSDGDTYDSKFTDDYLEDKYDL